MTTTRSHPSVYHNFSLAFNQMCGFAAIAKSSAFGDTLNHLVLHCLVSFPDEPYREAGQVGDAIYALAGLRLPKQRVQMSLDFLVKSEQLVQNGDGVYLIPDAVLRATSQRIESARSLERQVSGQWQEEITQSFPEIPPDLAWKALSKYLTEAFRRHGLQTAALLEPTIEVNGQGDESLTLILRKVITEHFSEAQHSLAHAALSSFLAGGPNRPERSAYIAQLGDGAFSYFSLTVPPEIAEEFRKQLKPLTLFLDTNFLFGILNLHSSPHVDVSHDLLASRKKFGLPFEVYYHPETEREMRGTIDTKGAQLRAHRWRTAMSRAAIQVRYLTGIEQQYHQAFLSTGIDVESFLRPFEHLDVLLAERGIKAYGDLQPHLEERATLYHEYAEYLKRIGKSKAYRTISHDTTVLETVRLLRSEAKSSLEAGALLMTCDYTLYRFDWETSRERHTHACTVLPNLFWQVLRPFIPQDADFDRAFADTFALPEFRTVNSDTGRVASKMMGFLNSYKDVTEATAKSLLSYDVLYNGLQHMQNDQAMREYIESELAKENALLQERAQTLNRQVHIEKAEKQQIASDLDRERTARDQVTAALAREQAARADQEAAVTAERLREQEAISAELMRERTAREQAERRTARMLLFIAVIGVLVAVAGFEFAIQKIPLTWVAQHSQSYGLRAAFYTAVLLGIVGWVRPTWRRWCWGTGVVTFLGVIYQLLGGPSPFPGAK